LTLQIPPLKKKKTKKKTLLIKNSGVSQGMLSTVRLIGGAIATAIYTAIQQNQYTKLFAPRIEEAVRSTNFAGSLQSLLTAATNGTAAAYQAVPGINSGTILATQGAIKQANAESFQLVYKVAIAFGGLAVLCALTTRNIPKSKKTNARAVALENENLAPVAKTVA
jgi:flavin-binding protein dodecin